MSKALPGCEELRPQRERLRLTLDEVSLATRLSVEWLSALEENRPADLPGEPYRSAYLRMYREALELGPPPEVTETEPELTVGERSAPPVRGRALMGLLVGAAALILAAGVWLAYTAPDEEIEAPSASEGAQTVRIQALKPGQRVSVRADGELVFEGALPTEEASEFSARKRLEIAVPAVGAVRLRHNGAVITPQGRQDTPRNLVFLDDRAGWLP